ncbi:MAG: type II toxin-antitoxin system VapC family toxin [Terriglobales bacterium]
MAIVVVDASVVVKWVLPEPETGAALQLLHDFESGQLDLIAPRLLLSEIASSLTKRHRRHELSAGQALAALEWVRVRCPRLVDADLTSALHLSLRLSVSLWDALYVVTAVERNCEFITADRRLVRAVAGRVPGVRLLSAHAD